MKKSIIILSLVIFITPSSLPHKIPYCENGNHVIIGEYEFCHTKIVLDGKNIGDSYTTVSEPPRTVEEKNFGFNFDGVLCGGYPLGKYLQKLMGYEYTNNLTELMKNNPETFLHKKVKDGWLVASPPIAWRAEQIAKPLLQKIEEQVTCSKLTGM